MEKETRIGKLECLPVKPLKTKREMTNAKSLIENEKQKPYISLETRQHPYKRKEE